MSGALAASICPGARSPLPNSRTMLRAAPRGLLPRLSRAASGAITPSVAAPRPRVAAFRSLPPSFADRGFSTADDAYGARVNVYAQYTVYKSKAAVTLKLIRPTWARVDSGLSVQREGALLLEFASSKAEREYDWDNKQTFGLNAAEVGAVLEALEGSGEARFVHDPNMNTRQAGSTFKSLRLSRGKDQTYFLSIQVQDRAKGSEQSSSVPVAAGEMRVIKTVMEYVIPHLLGFDEVLNGPIEPKDPSQGSYDPLQARAARDVPPF